jgi:leucyl/phenylalanyl-tRNA--protein transferase
MQAVEALTSMPGLSSTPQGREARRAAMFRETPAERLSRWALGIVYAGMPKRINHLPHLLLAVVRDMARGGTRLPDGARLSVRPDTFAGVALGITPEHVLAAARRGFFPWCHVGPLKWWTRKERMVLLAGDYRMSKNLRRIMRKNPYRVTFDTAFDEVIKACAGRRRNRFALTWITPRIMRLYATLHDQGHAHSFEVWNDKGELVGGGYGLSVGRCFFTESQFSLESNTSKMGFATLIYHLDKWGYVLNDGKDRTPTLEEAGFRLMPRAELEAVLAAYAQGDSPTAAWTVEADLAAIAKWEPKAEAAARKAA